MSSIIISDVENILRPVTNSLEELDSIMTSTTNGMTAVEDLWNEEAHFARSNLYEQISEIHVTDKSTQELKNTLLTITKSSEGITPSNLINTLRNILEGQTGISEDLDKMITTTDFVKNPRHLYHKTVSSQIDKFAKNVVGFESEEEFRNFVDEVKDPNSSEVKRVFNKLSKWAGNNKSVIAKMILAVGMGAPFLAMIKKFQRENTGCFVYYTDDDDKLKRFKILDRSCAFDQYLLANTDDENYSSLESHPLDGISWDCSYDTSGLQIYDKWKILEAGCNAICEPRNYNRLASQVPGYFPISLNSNDQNKYWKCEKSTFLRALAIETGGAMRNVAEGLAQGLDLNLPKIQTVVFYIFIFILILTVIWLFYQVINTNTRKNIRLNR